MPFPERVTYAQRLEHIKSQEDVIASCENLAKYNESDLDFQLATVGQKIHHNIRNDFLETHHELLKIYEQAKIKLRKLKLIATGWNIRYEAGMKKRGVDQNTLWELEHLSNAHISRKWNHMQFRLTYNYKDMFSQIAAMAAEAARFRNIHQSTWYPGVQFDDDVISNPE